MVVNQSRSWMVTLPEAYYSRECVMEGLKAYTYMGQLESGESDGYTHWQIYIENPSPIKFDTLRSKFPKGHFEKRRGSKDECFAYVTKKKTSLGVIVSNGVIELREKKRGRGEEIERLREMIIDEGLSYRDVLLKEPCAANHVVYLRELEQHSRAQQARLDLRDVDVRYMFGESGVGKTHWVYETYGFDAVYAVSNYSTAWDAYNYEPVIFLDEFEGQIDFTLLLKVLDKYPLRLPARYNDKWAAYSTVVIASNLALSELYKDVQARSRAQWRALWRRIDHYEVMDVDHCLASIPKAA